MQRVRLPAWCGAIGIILASAAPAVTQDQPAFFKGKTITLAVGAPTGGSLDLQARLLSRFLGNHIPGNPTVVVSYVPGAGSKILANRMYNIAPKDGTWIGALFPSAIVDPVFAETGTAKYDPRKFVYLGSGHVEVPTCIIRNDAPVKRLEDLLATEVIVASTAPGGPNFDVASIAAGLAELKFRMVKGYAGGRGIMLALERNEAQVICGAWSLFKVTYPGIAEGKQYVRPIFQTAIRSEPELTAGGVPMLVSVIKSDEARRALELFASQYQFASPYVLPPEVPAEQGAVLRRAFESALKDPGLLAEAKKANVDVALTSSDELQALVGKIYNSPKTMIDRVRSALAKAR